MNGHFEQYMLHPIEKPITDADAKVDLIRSKDHPIMNFFYESAFYRRPCVICDREYALPYDEFFCFASTDPGANEDLGATVTFRIAGEDLITDRNCMILVPAFVPHGPIAVTDVKTPIFSYCGGAGREHVSLPRENWNAADVPAMKDMVLYYNGDREDPQRRPTTDQFVLMMCISNKTMKGDVFSVLRRFGPTQGWDFANGHLHDNPEILCYYGMDPWRPYELHGTYTQFIGGEKHIISKPTLCYFPPYVIHCPLSINKSGGWDFWHSFSPSLGAYKSSNITGMALGSGEVDMKEPW